jgi:hypothetical protein
VQGQPVRAHTYKILLYEKGGHLDFHTDTEKQEGMFGTLIVQLPCHFTGGAYVVRNNGRTDRYDMSANCADDVRWVAHFADSEHCLEKVTDGHRLAIVYSLCMGHGQVRRRGRRCPPRRPLRALTLHGCASVTLACCTAACHRYSAAWHGGVRHAVMNVYIIERFVRLQDVVKQEPAEQSMEQALASKLEAWLAEKPIKPEDGDEDDENGVPNLLAFALQQQYSEKALQGKGVQALKGIDHTRAQQLVAANDLLKQTQRMDLFLVKARRSRCIWSAPHERIPCHTHSWLVNCAWCTGHALCCCNATACIAACVQRRVACSSAGAGEEAHRACAMRRHGRVR